MVGNSDNITGIGLFDQSTVAGEEELRRVQRQWLAGADQLGFHSAGQHAGANPNEGNAIPVIRVHIGLDLEHKPCHRLLVGGDRAGIGVMAARRRCHLGQSVDQVADAEIPQRGAEEYRRQMAFQKGRAIERTAGLHGERQLPTRNIALVLGQQGHDPGILRAVDLQGLLVGINPPDAVGPQIIGARKAPAAADGPCDRCGIEGEGLLDLVQQVERIAGFAVHLVNECHNRDIPKAADFEQLPRAGFNTLGGVNDHDGGVDGGQRPVGILRKVLVARRIEQVEDTIGIFEGHHRGDNRDAAGALDPHPVRPRLRSGLLRLDSAGELDCTAKQQELLRQGRLAGVRMRDDREGPAAGGLAFLDHAEFRNLWPSYDKQNDGIEWNCFSIKKINFLPNRPFQGAVVGGVCRTWN